MPETRWSAILAYLVSSRSERDLILQNLWMTLRSNTQGCPLAFTGTHMCVYVPAYTYTQREGMGVHSDNTVILVFRKLRQDEHEFKVSLEHTVRPCLKKINPRGQHAQQLPALTAFAADPGSAPQ